MLVVNMVPHVSAAGHWGGAIGGAVCAVLLTYQRFGTPAQSRLALAGLALTPVVAVAWLVHAIDTQPNWIEIVEKVELLQCRDWVAPQVSVAKEQFLKEYDDQNDDAGFTRLLKMRRSEWKAEDVAKALQRLRSHREELQLAADRLAAAGPFRRPTAVKFLTASEELLRKGAKLAEGAEDYLQNEQGWREKEKVLDTQRAQFDQDDQAWEELRARVRTLTSQLRRLS
jgi:hypothetical protein